MKRNLIQKVEKKKSFDVNLLNLHAIPDLSYRDMTATNKYMRKLSTADGKLEGECYVDSNVAKMNTDLIKVDSSEIRSGMFFSQQYGFSEVTWQGDEIYNPLDIEIPLESLNIDNSINYLLPTDSTLFFYDYSNRDYHSFRRSFLINYDEFSPYSSLPVFSFCPIFTRDKISCASRTWHTFGLRSKYILAIDLQQSVKEYTTIMFSKWFPTQFNEDVKKSLNDYGLTDYIAKALGLVVLQDSYSSEHYNNFLALVLNSKVLHWYNSDKTTPYEKLKFYINGKHDTDKRFTALLSDSEHLEEDEDSLFYYIDSRVTPQRVTKLLIETLFNNNVSNVDKARLNFLAYLWWFQNRLCMFLAKFTKIVENSVSSYEQPDISELLEIETAQANDYTMNDISYGIDTAPKAVDLPTEIAKVFKKPLSFDKQLDNTMGTLTTTIDALDSLVKNYVTICEVALRSKYLTENYFNKNYTIHHKFMTLSPKVSDFMFIKYNGKKEVEKEPEEEEEQKEGIYKNEFGQIVVADRDRAKKADPIKGKSIVFKYSIFTIILYNAIKGESRGNRITKEEKKDKSDLQFEKVIVCWGKNYIDFSNTEGDNKVWYEAYHTYGKGKTKGVDEDPSCMMIRFRPDMNIKYSYSAEEKANNVEFIHSLFRMAFYIMDCYFEELDISFIAARPERDHNVIRADIGEGIVIQEAMTKEEQEVEVNKQQVKTDRYNLTMMRSYAVQGSGEDEKKVVYCAYKDGSLKYTSAMRNPEADSRESRALKCIKDCLVDEGDHANIIQDDDWKQLTGDMFDDIQRDNSNEMVQENDENDAVKEVN